MEKPKEQPEKRDYCECKDLQGLYRLRNKASSLEAECNFFESNLVLSSSRKEDLDFLREYQTKITQFTTAVKSYNIKLTKLIGSGNLTPVLNRGKEHRRITLSDYLGNHKDSEDNITVNCSNCFTKIDELD